MAGPFFVKLADVCGQNKVGNVDTVVVYAEDATQARQAASARFGVGGEANGGWTDSSNGAQPLSAQPLVGIVFAIHIENGGSDIDVSVTADSDDVIDDIGGKLVTALNATAINGAAYNSGTNALTIAETTDTLGDKVVTVSATYTLNGVDIDMTASFFDNLVDGGASGDALTVDLLAGSGLGISAGLKLYS